MILEAKILYYRPSKHFKKVKKPSDEVYDAMEIEYLTLCRALGEVNSLVHKEYPGFEDIDYSQAMLEVDDDKPSVKLARDKIYLKSQKLLGKIK